jgi:diacylglycerol kinase (ATP)
MEVMEPAEPDPGNLTEKGKKMDNYKIAVIVNPVSANGKTAKRWPEVAAVMEKEGMVFDSFITQRPGDATILTRRALEQGYELIVAVGGDGTANEVINGFFERGLPVNGNAAAGFIPMGTGADLARTLGIPHRPVEAVRHLHTSAIREIDTGTVSYTTSDGLRQTRHFVNIAGLGLDGETAARANRTSKALSGFISFLWATVVTMLLYRNRQMTVAVDGKKIFEGPVTSVVAANGRYFGGGMCIAPDAVIDDRLFDVIIIHNLSKAKLLLNLSKVYSGAHVRAPQLKNHLLVLRGRKIKVESPGPVLLNLDGEQPGWAPVEVELQPLSLRIKG